MDNRAIISLAATRKAPSPARLAQLEARLDRLNKAEFSKALRGDEAGYEKAKRLAVQALNMQLVAVAAKALAARLGK